ncbi:hypothetical protein F5148DRAFT_337681 [Russula earlei]|uniref:Uncharacterized protein n=1 Tax=Russula earlei TaxID=71964 RepID=A0ACC0U3C1_9AGAM|nr:hypothetical protein F5148DRAFT_337681 [Russula earlei]
MSARLASFRGPSTPSSSPVVQQVRSPTKPTQSAARKPPESTYHRMVRASLQELRTACRTWDDLVRKDGLKAIRELIDARTDLGNMLALVPDGEQPRSRIVGPKLSYMDERIAAIELVVSKLGKQFQKMNTIVEGMEALLADAHKAKGWEWVCSEPMWTTWPMEKFVTDISDILWPYRLSLELHVEILDTLRSHDVSFETSRKVANTWVEQPNLEDDSWDAKWEDLCEVEIDRWDAR